MSPLRCFFFFFFFHHFFSLSPDNRVHNMCDDVSAEITDFGDVYLASSSFYPSAPAVQSNTSCRCRLISIDTFSAQALYLSQPHGWNFTCLACDITFQQEYYNYPVVNKVLFLNATQNKRYVLDFNLQLSSQNGTANQELWIRFKGLCLQSDSAIHGHTKRL